MSVQFASGGNNSDLANFAAKAAEIDIGGLGVEDIGDDFGIRPVKSTTNGQTVRFASGGGGGAASGGEMPSIKITPFSDNLEVVDLDATTGMSDIKITRADGPPPPPPAPEPAPFVIHTSSEVRSTPSAPPESSEMRKQALLTKLERLDAKGITGKRMNMGNTEDEIRAEVEKRTDSKNLEASVRFQRAMMITFVTGAEMVNEKYGRRLPIQPRLKGWSESVQTNIEDYDDIFEELYDMYKDKSQIHPAIRLIGQLGISAAMFHMTNTMAEQSGIPGMKDVLQENPDLQRQVAQAMLAKMGGMGAAMGAMSGIGSGQPTQMPRPPSPPMGANTRMPMAPTAPRREMRGPAGGVVDDVLKAFDDERAAAQSEAARSYSHPVFTPSPASPHRDFDNQSTGSGGTTNTERRRGRPRANPVGATLSLNV